MASGTSETEGSHKHMASKLKSPSQGPESNTMDSFQDGGQSNLDRSRGEFVSNMDGPHTNSNVNNYPQGGPEQSMPNDNFGKMNDSIPGPQVSNYNANFGRGGFPMGDQHGGHPSSSSSNDYGQPNSQYPSYGQGNMHPGYSPSGRGDMMSPRPGMGGSGMGMVSPNYHSGQQRMGPGMPQQGGPTPTLNQLLQQNASPGRGYQSGYGEYPGSQGKGMNESPNSGAVYNNSQSWQRPPVSPYQQQQMHGNQPFRNQSRHPSGYSGNGGGQFAPGGFSPSGQRYPSPAGGGGPMGHSNMPNAQGYPSQQMGYNQSNASPMGFNQNHQASPQAPNYPSGQPQQQQQQHPPQQPSPVPGQRNSPAPQSSPAHPGQSSTPSQPDPSSGQKTPTPTTQDGSAGEESDVASRSTPTSATHPSVSALRPAPSPTGSSGSRSNTPASIPGNQAGSPMPPRPPSGTQMEGPNRIQSPMANSGYPPQMMPPPMGHNQMGGYGNKMHASMPSQYPQQHNSHYPQQQAYPPRPQGGMMGGYQNSYPQGGGMYPGGMGRSMANNYPNSYQGPMGQMNSSGGMPNQMGHMNSGPMGPSQMNNSMGSTSMSNSNMAPGMNNSNMAPGMNNSNMAPGMNNSNMAPGMNNSNMAPGINSGMMNSTPYGGYNNQGMGHTPAMGGHPNMGHGPGMGPNQAPNIGGTGMPMNNQSLPAGGSQTPNSNSVPPNQTAPTGGPAMSASPPINTDSPSGVQSPGPKAAQAAAQAAVIAAANSSRAAANRASDSPGTNQPQGSSTPAPSDTSSPGMTPPHPPGSDTPTNMSTSQPPASSASTPSGSSPMPNQTPPSINSQPTMNTQPGVTSQHQGPMNAQSTMNSQPGMIAQPSIGGPTAMGQPGHQMPMGGQPNMGGHPHQNIGGPGGMGGYPGMQPHGGMGHPGMGNQPNMAGHGPMMGSHAGMAHQGMGPHGGMSPGMGMGNMPHGMRPQHSMPGHGRMYPGQYPGNMGPGGYPRPGMMPHQGHHSMDGMGPSSGPQIAGPPSYMGREGSHGNMASGPGMGGPGMGNMDGMHPSMSHNGPSTPGSVGRSTPQAVPDVMQLNRAGSAGSLEADPAKGNAGDTGSSGMSSMTAPMNSMTAGQAGSSSDSDSMPPPSTTPTPTPNAHIPVPSPMVLEGNRNECSSDGSFGLNPPQLHDDSSQSSMKRENLSNPPTPHIIAPSPSASMSSLHDDFDNISSPSWPGTPVGGSGPQMMQGSGFKPTVSEGLSKMYEMGDEPDRRMFLDKVFSFNEERGTPVTAMPMISKQPIDLYKLYMHVKEKGGLLEVTKNKKWRDIAQAINVGSSGSAGFTLRKNYVKYLFPYECRFERGGIDPTPILAQIDAMSQKKDSRKNASNAGEQQAFPPQQPNQPYGYGGQQQMSGPPGMRGDMMPNNMMPPLGNQSQGYDAMPNNTFMGATSGGQMINRGRMGEGGYQEGNYSHPGVQGGYNGPGGQGNYAYQRQGYSGQGGTQYGNSYRPMQGYPNQGAPGANHSGQFPYGQQGDRFDGPNSGGPTPGDPMYRGQFPGGQQMGARPNGPQDQYGGNFQRPYPGQGQYGYGSGSSAPRAPFSADSGGSFGGEAPPRMAAGIAPGVVRPPGSAPGDGGVAGGSGNQWRGSGPQYSQGQAMPPSASGMPPFSVFNRMNQQRMSPQRSFSDRSPQKGSKQAGGMRKDQLFPSDIVEGIPAVMGKRKKLNQKDLSGQVDPWRLIMSLKSGQLAESTWALDVLTILLYDDNTVQFFHLAHLPGLVEVLLDHFRQCLIQLFPEHFTNSTIQAESSENSLRAKRRRHSSASSTSSSNDDEKAEPFPLHSLLGPLREPPDPEDIKPGDYTWKTRQGCSVSVCQDTPELHYVLDDKRWDEHAGFSSSSRIWEQGKGDITSHILTYFDNMDSLKFQKSKFFGPYLKHVGCKSHLVTNASDNSMEGNTPPAEDLDLAMDTKDTEHVALKQEPEESKEHCKEDECEKAEQAPHSSPCAMGKENGCLDCLSQQPIKSEPLDTALEKPRLNCQDTKPLFCDNKKISDKIDSISADIEKVVHKSCSLPNGDISESMDTEEDVPDKHKHSGPVKQTSPDPPPAPSPAADQSADKEQSPATPPPADMPTPAPAEGSQETSSSTEDSKPDCPAATDELTLKYQSFMTARQCNDKEATLVDKLKRSWEDGDEEAESHCRDASPLYLTTEAQDQLARRCVCLSNVLRSLSFVPGNDSQLSQHRGLVLVCGRLLLLHHRHPKQRQPSPPSDKEDCEPACTDPMENHIEDAKSEWWWDTVDALRENALVTMSNIAGRLELGSFPESIAFCVLDGLLHWAVCRAACAQDPLPTVGASSLLSPMRLSLETLCKLSITQINVDLLLATPPFGRLVQLFSNLVQLLAGKEQVLREFAVVLLSAVVRGHSSAARAVALQPSAISLLLDFIESAEAAGAQVMGAHGSDMVRDNPDVMGTSLDMLKRAAIILQHIAKVPQNRLLMARYQERLLALVISQVLDQSVMAIISDVLFHCSQS